MIVLRDVIDLCRAEALAYKLVPSDEADWRWFCREYSKTFHTPLHLVEAMTPEYVIVRVLEDGLDSKHLRKREDASKVIEELRRVEDPNYDLTQAEEFEEFAEGIEEWDNQRLAKGAKMPTKNTQPEAQLDPPKKKEGFIDLSYLENNKNER